MICDAHTPTGGIVEDGHLPFDAHAFPLRISEVPGSSNTEEIIKQIWAADPARK